MEFTDDPKALVDLGRSRLPLSYQDQFNRLCEENGILSISTIRVMGVHKQLIPVFGVAITCHLLDVLQDDTMYNPISGPSKETEDANTLLDKELSKASKEDDPSSEKFPKLWNGKSHNPYMSEVTTEMEEEMTAYEENNSSKSVDELKVHNRLTIQPALLARLLNDPHVSVEQGSTPMSPCS
jgi:hypothetical protein